MTILMLMHEGMVGSENLHLHNWFIIKRSTTGDVKHTRAWWGWKLFGETGVRQQRGFLIIIIIKIKISITSSPLSLSSSSSPSRLWSRHQDDIQVAGQPGPDSGYVSHSSGGGYPKLQVDHHAFKMLSHYLPSRLWGWKGPMMIWIQVPMSNAVKSFTMSMDRGFLGGPANKISVLMTNNNKKHSRKKTTV